ncbi:MAG TPA: sulfatase-like hydrolase/transferase [Bryobacteraceae bacterium]|nr:sulfatase-like hydrolase/transferase [Bryobacteraceae bacterium]
MASRRSFLGAAAASALAAPQGKPNFLFFLPDQWRPDWMPGNASIPVRLPHIAALAARGMRFRHVLCASPLCAPSRACLATGREYKDANVASNQHDFPLSQATYYQSLQKAGYHTMACGKIDLHKKTLDWGLDGQRLLPEWGFSAGIDNAGKGDAVRSGASAPKDPYMAMLHKRELASAHVADFRARRGYSATHNTPLPDDAYCDNWIAENAKQLLAGAPKGKPWHLVVNFTGPHNPMDITASMERGARDRAYPAPNASTEFDDGIHQKIRQNYTAMCENIDRRIGEIVDAVARRGELENTLIVFSSDHGEMLGDHNRWGKHVPYQASAGVPLIVAGLDVQRSRTSDALASLIDISATFLDYGGCEPLPGMAASSLRPVLTGQTKKHRDVLHSALEEWRLVWDGRYKLIEGFQGETMLFDLQHDPLENKNLVTLEKDQVTRLRKRLI